MTDIDHIRSVLNTDEIHRAAQDAATQLADRDYCFVSIHPGDATAYMMTVVSTPDNRPARYMVATNYAPLYPWAGDSLDVSYTYEKWGDGNWWTAEVTAQFLTALAQYLREIIFDA